MTPWDLPPRLAKRLAVSCETGCWLWLGGRTKVGYGTIHVGQSTTTIHRYILTVQGIDVAGMDVDHLCKVYRCFNPVHLEVVTHHENMHRAAPWEAARRFPRRKL